MNVNDISNKITAYSIWGYIFTSVVLFLLGLHFYREGGFSSFFYIMIILASIITNLVFTLNYIYVKNQEFVNKKK